MKRYLLLVLIAGCGSPSQPPTAAKATGPEEKPEAVTPVDGPKPERTSPEAKAVLDKLLIAHTGNNSKALEAFRQCKVTRSGVLHFPDGKRPAQILECYSWPNQFRYDWSVTIDPSRPDAPARSVVLVNGGTVKSATPHSAGELEPLNAAMTRDNLEDIHAHSMTLLFPLLDPSVVAVLEPAAPAGTVALRVWVLDRDPVVYIIDQKTGFMTKLLYAKKTANSSMIWTFELENFTDTRSVMLPNKLKRYSRIQVLAELDSAKYVPNTTFPEGFDKK